MVELMTEMWIYLAGAALIGLIIGWAFRGAFLPRPKTVSVMQGARTTVPAELTDEQKAAIERAEQADAAISALEARVKTAQEAAAAFQGDIADLKLALKTAEDKLSEAETSGPDISGTVLAGAAGAAIGALTTGVIKADEVSDFTNDPKLEWRSRYLESRVRHLESLLADKPMRAEPPQVDTSAIEAELASAKAALGAAESRLQAILSEHDTLKAQLSDVSANAVQAADDQAAVSLSDFARMQWQNRYLKARVLHLEESFAGETYVATEPKALASDETHEVDTLKSEITVLKAELARASGTDTEAEKELARLRWRNRYLEGRLKYLEAASLDAASDADDTTDGVAAALSAVAAPVSPPAETVPGTVLPTVDPSDEVRPLSLDAPRGGQPDDLKRIGGIGPKIEGILNELGIFHFDQVAAWTDKEAAWVDSYLRFQGRVQREKWVDQAVSLQKAIVAADS